MSTGIHLRCNRSIDGVMHKQCSRCKAWKPRATYSRKGKGGKNVASWCRACENAYQREYYKTYYVPVSRQPEPSRSIDATGTTLARVWR